MANVHTDVRIVSNLIGIGGVVGRKAKIGDIYVLKEKNSKTVRKASIVVPLAGLTENSVNVQGRMEEKGPENFVRI